MKLPTKRLERNLKLYRIACVIVLMMNTAILIGISCIKLDMSLWHIIIIKAIASSIVIFIASLHFKCMMNKFLQDYNEELDQHANSFVDILIHHKIVDDEEVIDDVNKLMSIAKKKIE